MAREGVTLYRCLRSDRRVAGGVMHNECADIMERNAGLDSFKSTGLDWKENPCFYQPDYFIDEERNWYIAGRTAVVRVQVECVVEIP